MVRKLRPISGAGVLDEVARVSQAFSQVLVSLELKRQERPAKHNR